MQGLGALPATNVKYPRGRPAQLRQPGELRAEHFLADHVAQSPEHANPAGRPGRERVTGICARHC